MERAVEEGRQAPRWVPSPEELAQPVRPPAAPPHPPSRPPGHRSPGPQRRAWWHGAAAGATAVVVVLVLGLAALRVTVGGDTPVLPGQDTRVLYAAEEGVITTPTFVRDGAEVAAADRAVHEELWAQWTAMVPPYWTRRVSVFEIASDGPEGIAASVRRLDRDGDRWLLAVDPADAELRPERYLDTLVHELAHILTLGDGAVEVVTADETPSERAARCGGVPVPEGCPVEGTVLHRFVNTFWSAEDRDVSAGDGLIALVEQRYLDAPDSYVSPYAASGPAEDIAETFVALALSHAQPSGSIAQRKIELLRSDPELFALADRIRVAVRGG